jgi:hypothetical protein
MVVSLFAKGWNFKTPRQEVFWMENPIQAPAQQMCKTLGSLLFREGYR